MSRPGTRSSRRRILIVAIPPLLAGVLALAAIVRVPGGHLAVIGRPGSAGARVVGPGLHVRTPFLERRATFRSGPAEVEGALEWTSSEGAALRLPYRFLVDAGAAAPPVLLLHAADGDLVAAARRVADAALRPADPGRPGSSFDAASARARLEAALAGLGLVAGSLQLGSPAPASLAGAPRPSPGLIGAVREAYRGPQQPVLVIGVDSADWAVMDSMINRGDLPALRSLKERGAWGVLKSSLPLLSPLLWTTIATGKSPDEHGIVDFLAADPRTGRQLPISSRLRRARALWSILTELGRPSLTVAWWATWPAEAVEGEMITDRVAYSLLEEGEARMIERAVHPPDLAAVVEAEVVQPDEVPYEEVCRIIEVGREEYARARASLNGKESWRDPVAHLLRILSSTLTYHRIALSRLRAGQPPLTLVYYQGLDEVNHRFAHYADPAMRWADPAKVPAFRHAVENFYRLQDSLVADLLAAVSRDTVVLVISDHGFGWGDARPTDVPPDIEGKPGRWHTLDGVVIAAGPTVKRGRLARDPGLLDIAPTILALLSLPLAEDMPGKVIAEIVPPGSVPPPSPASIATYEPPGPVIAEGAEPSPADEEMLARLTALGYIGGGVARGTGVRVPGSGEEVPGPGSAPPPGAAGTVTGHLNAGNVLLLKGSLAEAEAEYRSALALAPAYTPARLGLAQCQIAAGRETEGWAGIAAALREGQDLDAGIYMKVAGFYRRHRRYREGADLFAGLPVREGLEAARLTGRAILLARAGDEEGALTDLRAALREDPAFTDALREIHALLGRRTGSAPELIAVLEEALRARPGGVLASNLLALTYERAGRADDAENLLRRLLETSPRDVATLTNLGGILSRGGRDAEALPFLERARQVDPSSREATANLIVVQGRLRDLAGARETWRSAGPAAERSELLNAIAYACYLNGDLAEARRLILRSLERDPRQPDARRLLAAIDEAAGMPHGPESAPAPGL